MRDTRATVLSATAAASDTSLQRPAGVTADGWTEVQRSIHLEQYGVVADGIAEGRYRATDPVQRFEARFDPGGVQLAPPDGKDWEWGLALRAWGRDDALESASATALESRQERVEFDCGLLRE